MALIKKLEHRHLDRHSLHGETEAKYSVHEADGGRKVLQIDTYGSKTRKIPGKTSQTIQFGPEGIKQLKAILDKL